MAVSLGSPRAETKGAPMVAQRAAKRAGSKVASWVGQKVDLMAASLDFQTAARSVGRKAGLSDDARVAPTALMWAARSACLWAAPRVGQRAARSACL